MLNYSIIIMLN